MGCGAVALMTWRRFWYLTERTIVVVRNILAIIVVVIITWMVVIAVFAALWAFFTGRI